MTRNQQIFRTQNDGNVLTPRSVPAGASLNLNGRRDAGESSRSTLIIQNVMPRLTGTGSISRRIGLIVLLVAISALALAGCGLPFGDDESSSNGAAVASSGDEPPGVLLESAEPAPDFSLTGHDGELVSLTDLEGKVVAIFFGYTACPDVCPMTLGHMAQASEALGDDAEHVEYLLISVDPERDAPEQLEKYVSRIDAPITGLTGSQDMLEPVWDDYDITVERRDREDGGYLVDHSAQVWIVDQRGDLVMFMPMGADGDELTAALRWLLDNEAS
jgi:protein SCO1